MEDKKDMDQQDAIELVQKMAQEVSPKEVADSGAKSPTSIVQEAREAIRKLGVTARV